MHEMKLAAKALAYGVWLSLGVMSVVMGVHRDQMILLAFGSILLAAFGYMVALIRR